MLLSVFSFPVCFMFSRMKPERPSNPLTFFAIRETSNPDFPREAKSGVAGRYKERIVIVVKPETLAFCFISRRRRRLYIVPKKRRRAIKPCPRRAHRCGVLSGKRPSAILTRQTLKGRSLGFRSRNNAFRYRRFKSKISSI